MADDQQLQRLPNGRFPKGYVAPVRRRKGSLNKINRTVKEALTEAANNLGGKKGAVGVFEQAGKKDIVALANMLTKLVPTEIAAEINDISSVGPVNIISVPPGHMICPDGFLRPDPEAKHLWDATHLRPEPEVAELIEKAIKSKPRA
jgi:hypothetical protein